MVSIADRAGAAASTLFLAGVVLLPIMQVRIGVGATDLILSDVAFVLAGAATIVAVIGGRIAVRRTSFVAALLAYGVALLISLVAGGITRTTLSAAATGAYVAGLAAVAFHLVPARVSPVRFVRAFLAATAIAASTAVVGAVLFYAGRDTPGSNRLIGAYGSVPKGRYPRVIGTFASPNLLCNFLTCGLVALLTARVMGVISRRVVAVLLPMIAVAIAFTLSPGIGGALLAAGVCVWAFPALVRSPGLRRAALVAGVAGAVAFLGATVVELNLDDGLRHATRVDLWRDAGDRFLESPLVGVGLDENLGHEHLSSSPGAKGLLTDAHNMYLSLAGQMGVVGLGAIGATFVVTFLDAERRARIRGQPLAIGLAVALLGALAYHGLSMSAEDTRHLWVAVGALAGLAYSEPEVIAVS